MKAGTRAYLFEEGGKLLSSAVRVAMARPRKSTISEATETQFSTEVTQVKPQVEAISAPPPLPAPTKTPGEELDYRWECLCKHFGGASVLLREAYERAIDDDMEGAGEKVMEAMNEHSGAEADIDKMLAIPEAREEAEKLLSGIRAFRKAAWEANIIRGGGTKEDVADARLWNEILYTEAFNSAKSQPGSACVEEGM